MFENKVFIFVTYTHIVYLKNKKKDTRKGKYGCIFYHDISQYLKKNFLFYICIKRFDYYLCIT